MPDEQLVAYIKTQLAAGISNEDISKTLVTSGWQVSDINTAFSSINASTTPVQSSSQTTFPSTIAKRSAWPLIVASIVVVLGGSAFAAYYAFPAQPTAVPIASATTTLPIAATASPTSFTSVQQETGTGTTTVGVVDAFS